MSEGGKKEVVFKFCTLALNAYFLFSLLMTKQTFKEIFACSFYSVKSSKKNFKKHLMSLLFNLILIINPLI